MENWNMKLPYQTDFCSKLDPYNRKIEAQRNKIIIICALEIYLVL